MRDDLGKKIAYQTHGWYASLLKELDKQKEDE
jgi:hypothetical protein